MNDTKHENTGNSGWATPTDNATPSWGAATVDPSTVERIQTYEQKFREERAAKRAEREARAEQVTYTTETNVSDPSRVYTPLDRPAGQVQANREEEQAQLEADAAELATEAADIEAMDPATGWEAAEPELEAAQLEAEAIQLGGMSERAQMVEVAHAEPAVAEAIDPARAAARAAIERAFGGAEHDHGGLER